MRRAAATRALSVADRSYPTSEVRGRSQEDPMPEGRWPRGVTPHPRSRQRPRVPGCNGAGTAEKSYTSPRARTLNSGRLAQPCFWHFGGQRALDHLLGWEREGSTNCTLETS